MKPLQRLPLILTILLVVSFGCKSKKGEMPDTAEARVDQFAAKTPAKAESLVIVPDIATFRSKMSNLKGRVAETGMVEGIQHSLQQMFGVNILDEESWKAAGLTPKSSIGATIYKSRPILFLYVDNRQAFEKVLIERAKNAFQLEAVTKQETVGKHKVKVLSDDPAKQIAWLYDGKLALVAMPAVTGEGALEDGTAALVVTNVLDTKKEVSLAASPQFAKFKKDVLPNGVLSMYVNTEAYLQSPEVQEQLKQDPRAESGIAFIQKNIDYFGAYGDFEGDRLTFHSHIAGKEAFNAVAKEIAKIDNDGKWDGFVTDKLGLGLRVSVDPEKALNFAMTAMTDEEKRTFKRNMKRSGDQVGIDIEEDLIKGMTGHIGIFFYGIAGNNPMVALQAAQDPTQLASKLGLLAIFRFKSKDALDKIVAKLVANPQAPLALAPLKVGDEELTDFKSLTLPIPDAPVRVVVHNDSLLISTTAFGDSAIHGYLSGQRDKDKKLGSVKGMDLGKEFSTTKQFTGFYANAERLSSNPGQLLAMVGAGALVEVFEEAQLKVGANDKGAFITFVADLDAAPAAPAEKEEPKKEDK